MPSSSARSVTAWYRLSDHDDPAAVANAIARGQSVGNPTVVARYETPAMLSKHLPKTRVLGTLLEVKFPSINFSKEGVNYLMSVLMGGQCDVGDTITALHLEDVDLGRLAGTRRFPGPRYGKAAFPGPMVGAIIKPKIGLTPRQVAEVAQDMAAGGATFIKEDEILADQSWCPMKQRLWEVSQVLRQFPKVIYAACITGDGPEAVRKARQAKAWGATAVHLNIWCGLGTFWSVRNAVDIPIHFQKSGDRVWSEGPFSIGGKALYRLVNAVGCDFAHVGMYGGYLAETRDTLNAKIAALGNTVPAFSCGLNPESAAQIVSLFGPDVLLNSGGWIAGHPGGIRQACAEMVSVAKGVPCRS